MGPEKTMTQVVISGEVKELQDILEREPARLLDEIYEKEAETVDELKELYEDYRKLPEKKDLEPSEIIEFNKTLMNLYSDFGYAKILDSFTTDYHEDPDKNSYLRQSICFDALSEYDCERATNIEFERVWDEILMVDGKLRKISEEKGWEIESLCDSMLRTELEKSEKIYE